MKSISIAFSDSAELQKQLEEQHLQNDSRLLIQLFCAQSSEAFVLEMQSFFSRHLPQATLIGTTTDGIIDGVQLYAGTKNLAVLSYFDATDLKSEVVDAHDTHCSSYECGEKLATTLVQEDTKVLICFGDGLHLNGEEFVRGISEINSDVVVSGGLAGDNGEMQNTYVFDNTHITDSGAVGVALNNKNLEVATKYSFDWTAIGKNMRVSKSVKNRVFEIDGLSAVETYEKYFGKEVADKLPQIGIEFPLIFEQNGVFIGRAVLAKHHDGSLTFAGNIPEGTRVRFGVGSIKNILHNVHYRAEQLTYEMTHKMESIFVYSCMARRRFLQSNATHELEVLKQFGEVYGFYTYGEFFHSSGQNQLLNETMTLLSLSESQEQNRQLSCDISDKVLTHHVNTEHAIANLANVVSNELEELNKNLEHKVEESAAYIYEQAYTDVLTGLPNRLSLLSSLDTYMGKTLFLVNVDDFTTINDFYGHRVGDKVLEHLAKVLQCPQILKEFELFKLPSDEFALLVDLKQNKETTLEVIRQIHSCVESIKLIVDDYEIHISVTIGSAVVNEAKTGLINADMALKLAKKAGAAYMIFQNDLQLSEQYARNISTANVIKKAIEEDRIVPYFQPIYDAKTLQVAKYEALVRLITEEGDVLSPYSFLEISQKIRMYPKITEIMVEKTFEIMRQKGIACSLNLSFEDINNSQTRTMIFDKIEEYGIAQLLTVEILENQEIENEEVFDSFVEQMHTLGVQIAIDDFGSGYANFEHIAKIHSEVIKIDGSLIKNIDKDLDAKLIAETIVVFANKLGQKTVAEFVHSQEVLEIVQEIGVDYLQGYYFAPPRAELIS